MKIWFQNHRYKNKKISQQKESDDEDNSSESLSSSNRIPFPEHRLPSVEHRVQRTNHRVPATMTSTIKLNDQCSFENMFSTQPVTQSLPQRVFRGTVPKYQVDFNIIGNCKEHADNEDHSGPPHREHNSCNAPLTSPSWKFQLKDEEKGERSCNGFRRDDSIDEQKTSSAAPMFSQPTVFQNLSYGNSGIIGKTYYESTISDRGLFSSHFQDCFSSRAMTRFPSAPSCWLPPYQI